MGTYTGSNTFVPHAYNHSNGAIHYRQLKCIVDLSVKVLRFHQVMSYFQQQWLTHILIFTLTNGNRLIVILSTDFKLMNNAVVGQTMDNVKRHMELKLTTKYMVSTTLYMS